MGKPPAPATAAVSLEPMAKPPGLPEPKTEVFAQSDVRTSTLAASLLDLLSFTPLGKADDGTRSTTPQWYALGRTFLQETKGLEPPVPTLKGTSTLSDVREVFSGSAQLTQQVIRNGR